MRARAAGGLTRIKFAQEGDPVRTSRLYRRFSDRHPGLDLGSRCLLHAASEKAGSPAFAGAGRPGMTGDALSAPLRGVLVNYMTNT